MPQAFVARIAGLLFLFLMFGSGLARAQNGPGTLSFSPAIVTFLEGAGNATLTVARTGGSTGAISVNFITIDGSAITPVDYAATSGVINWADGETTSKPILIPVVQNTTLEGTRYFNVILSNATGGASIAIQNDAPGKAIVRIADDEPDPFPAGGVFPVGFSSEINQFFRKRWTVESDQGHLSPTSLQSGAVFGGYEEYYDENGNYVVSDVLSPGLSRLHAEGDFLAGNLTFSYKISAGPEAKLTLYSFSSTVNLGPGPTGWQTVVVPVGKGPNNFDWYFSNLATTPCAQVVPPTPDGRPCADIAYLDSIVLPPRANRLTVNISGIGSTLVSGEVACDTTYCNYFLSPGTVMTLTAVAPGGYFFAGWNSAECSGTGTCTLMMDAAKTVTAVFLPYTPRLTTSIADITNPGTGTITSVPAGINCPPDCTELFANGTTVTLTATADADSLFTGWQGGGCSGTDACVVTMTDFTTVQAKFANQFPQVSVQLSGTGMGTVTSSPPGINCPGTCSFAFPVNSQVTLTASPSAGSYGGILNLCPNAPASCTLSMYQSVSIAVQFQPGAIADAPTLLSALISGSSITVAFSPPGNTGGLPVSNYQASCGPLSMAGNASPLVLSGAAAGVQYPCTVTAVNAAGISLPSNVLIAIPQLALLGVVSQKSHGFAGTFSLPVTRVTAIDGPVTIEPRLMGGGHQLVFEFNLDVASVAAVTASTGSTSAAISGKRVFVTLTDVPDNRRALITLLGVSSAGGTRDESVAIGFLIGEVNLSRAVTAADIIAIKARSGQTADITNFQYDIDLSGTINGSDLTAVKTRAGLKLP